MVDADVAAEGQAFLTRNVRSADDVSGWGFFLGLPRIEDTLPIATDVVRFALVLLAASTAVASSIPYVGFTHPVFVAVGEALWAIC